MSPPARSLALALALAVSATSHASNTTLLRATDFVATPAFESPLMRRWGFAIFVRADAFVLMAGVDPGPDPTPEFETHLPLAVFRDVWTAPVSVQGLAWTRLTGEAQWPARARPSVAVVDAGVLLMSGVDRNGNVMNDVWWSSDPEFALWQKRPDFPWASRDGFGYVTHTTRPQEWPGKWEVYIVGGWLRQSVNDQPVLSNDVWVSSDAGISWTLFPRSESGEYWSPRAWPTVWIEPEQMLFVMGGVNTQTLLYDAWTTGASGQWAEVQGYSPFASRIALMYMGIRTWVVVGGANPHRLCDLWMMDSDKFPLVTNHIDWCSFDLAPSGDLAYFARWRSHSIMVQSHLFIFGATVGAQSTTAAVHTLDRVDPRNWHTLCIPYCASRGAQNGCGGICSENSQNTCPLIMYQVTTFVCVSILFVVIIMVLLSKRCSSSSQVINRTMMDPLTGGR